jgi:UDP-N-acetylglucosamine 4,6-dehydratase
MYVVEPTGALWFGHDWRDRGRPLPEGFTYTSDNNERWLSPAEIRELVAPYESSVRGGG